MQCVFFLLSLSLYCFYCIRYLFTKWDVILWIKLPFVSWYNGQQTSDSFLKYSKDYVVHNIFYLNSGNHQDKYLKKETQIYYWQMTISVSRYGDWFYNYMQKLLSLYVSTVFAPLKSFIFMSQDLFKQLLVDES